MVRAVLILAVSLAATSATAQSSTTNCQKDYFGNVTCQTNQNPGIDWSRAQQPQPNAGDAFNKGFNEAQERRRQAERDDMLREVIRQRSAPPPPAAPQISDDHRIILCQQSFDKAIAEGNFAGAEAVAKFCGFSAAQ